ncbi:hypothetical protein C8R43DRAFT_1116814 [Mycena crocata]|nr:hypothetical protein C8R43DRAFT_1116814 [Mycena crocata]
MGFAPGVVADQWKVHRSLCKSLTSGTWKEFTFRRPFAVHINRYDVVQHSDISERNLAHFNPTGAPENTHGEAPFIVKIQLAAADASNLATITGQNAGLPGPGDRQSMLIYDRHRSLEAELQTRYSDAAELKAVAGAVIAHGNRGLRLFCWANGTGYWTMRVCLDLFPDQEQHRW